MDISCKRTDSGTVVYMQGEIDHHNAAEARRTLDGIIEADQPARFGLDLSGVTFCDSSGLGLVMGRMKKCSSVGSVLVILDPSPAAEKILQIAGMDRIIKIEKRQTK
ncbi:MAG: anti-sigma factor antagonist [Clostridia bacterium]|nr:anti-sigma factor antagonist [Clostridia bacterium]